VPAAWKPLAPLLLLAFGLVAAPAEAGDLAADGSPLAARTRVSPLSPAASEPTPLPRASAAVEGLLRRLPVIRVILDDGPGNGHQAGTATVMQRLRELGFDGEFEVLAYGRAASNLHFILPGIDRNGPAEQYVKRLRTRVIVTKDVEATAAQRGSVPLVVTGGTDGLRWPVEVSGEAFLAWKPLELGLGQLLLRDRMPINFGSRGGYLSRVPAPSSPARFVEEEFAHDAGLRAKIPLMTELVRADAGRDVLPVYGVGVAKTVLGANRPVGGHEKIATLVDALAIARNAETGRFSSDIVLPVISPLSTESVAALRATLAEISRARGLDVEVVDADAAGARRLRARPARPRLTVALLGSIPKPAFELLYSRATLPPTCAGSNCFDLAAMLGIPALDTNASGSPPERVGPDEVRTLVAKASNTLRTAAADRQPLVDLLLEAKRPRSPLLTAFREERARILRSPDQVVEGLELLVREHPDLGPPVKAAAPHATARRPRAPAARRAKRPETRRRQEVATRRLRTPPARARR
jgi:hypothetical protein